MGSGRGVHEGESSTNLCGRSCTKPAPLVRGSSRRITIMRFRPANIRVINRRGSRLGHLRCCVLSNIKKRRTETNALRNKTLLSQTS